MANIEWKDINTINLELREFEIIELEFSFNITDINGEEYEVDITREINSRDYDVERIGIR